MAALLCAAVPRVLLPADPPATHCTVQFTHRLSGRSGEQPIETVVKVEDDSLFDVLVEFALDQPEYRVDCEAVESHWFPDKDGEHYVYSKDQQNIRCRPVVDCYAWLWANPLRCFTFEAWYSPMSPANLILTAGIGVGLSTALALVCYLVEAAKETSKSADVGFELDLNILGSMCAVLSGPSYLYAFFVRRDQQGTFIILRMCVLGIFACPMAIFSLGCACWRNEEASMLGAALWLGASVMQVWLYFCASDSIMARACHRNYLSCCRKKSADQVEEEEELQEEGEDQKLITEAKGEGEEEEEEEEEGGEEEEKKETRFTKCKASCLKAFAPILVLAKLIGTILFLLWQLLTWKNLFYVLATVAHVIKRFVELVCLLGLFFSGASLTYQNYKNLVTDEHMIGQHLARSPRGERSHMLCSGTPPVDDRHPRPAVILESSEMLGQALAMDDLRLRLEKDGIVCTYDRAGFGWSGPGVTDRSPREVAKELAFMLTNGSNAAPPSVVLRGHAHPVQPPFVLAGHSAGSIYMRQFAVDFPELTAAIVSFDGLPVIGDGPAGNEAYKSDLQTYFTR